MLQRIVDIVISLTALLLLFPLLLPLCLLLRFTGEGKIFYKQTRAGFGGLTFGLLKFATMLEDSPNLPGGDITSGNDPRVLPFGRLLRKTKINELPQLVNILFGQMSFVGPRPLTPRNFELYDEQTQEVINNLKPGLTGIGSIIFRDEEAILSSSTKGALECYREDISPYKGELEKWYFQNQSINNYTLLIFITVWVVIIPRSIIVWKVFPDVPSPPKYIQKFLMQ
jgi:lipopolysaccharide/colanic/teichoic acid biosynthesis glycosyltransferase